MPSVPKCGRGILPLSIPDTVVGLTLASSGSLARVHIRERRKPLNRSPVSRPSIGPSRFAIFPYLAWSQRKHSLLPHY